MKNINITIIGAGSGGCALAGVLGSNNNVSVCIYSPKGFAERNMRAIKSRGGIELFGAMETFGEVKLVTDDIKQAVRQADLIFVVLPSYAQKPSFNSMLPHLNDGQTIVSMPGNFASLCYQKEMQAVNKSLDLTYVEAESIPFACRAEENARVNIFAIKKHLTMSVSDIKHTQKLTDFLENLLPCPITCSKNLLQSGFQNLNGIIHPVNVLLNTGFIENTAGNFYFYKDGVSPSIGKLMEQMDFERIAIAKAYGIEVPSFLNSAQAHYGGKRYNSIYEISRNLTSHSQLTAPSEIVQNRYISEDVPFVMVPWLELAEMANVDVPTISTVVSLATLLNKTDYRSTGRNLQAMGVNNLSYQEIRSMFENPNFNYSADHFNCRPASISAVAKNC